LYDSERSYIIQWNSCSSDRIYRRYDNYFERTKEDIMKEELIIKEEMGFILPHIFKIGAKEINFNYDKEADVMYVSFEKRKKADLTDDSHYPTIYRYANNELIGITIINYSSVVKS